jgi:hypothetical protein
MRVYLDVFQCVDIFVCRQNYIRRQGLRRIARVLVDRLSMSTCEWVRAPTLNPCINFANPWLRYLAKFTWEPSVEDTTWLLSINEVRGFLQKKTRQEGSHGWSVAYITCTGSERTIRLHGKVNTTAISRNALPFLRQWHRMICGFGTLSLA